MLTGNVFTYYGEEIGMVGAGEDPNKRLPMYWNDSDMTDLAPGVTKVEYAYPCADDQLADPDSLLNYCREVNHIRLENPAIARGENKFILDDKWVCAMERTYGEETLVIAMNFSASKEKSVELPIENMQIAHDLEVGEGAAFLDGSMLTLPPYGIVILK